MAVMRILRVAGVVLAATLCLPAAAWAHATLLRTVPADGSVLPSAPQRVTFVFDDSVHATSGIKAVRNDGGSVLGGKPRTVGKTLVVPLRRGIGDGDYTVLWRIISNDGHTEAGVISFAVGSGQAPPTASLTATNGPSAGNVFFRWLFFAGLLVASGGAVFRLVLRRGDARVLFPAFLLMIVGGAGLLGHHGTLSTRFGLAYGIATIIAAVGATLAGIAFADARAEPFAWAAALLVLPAPSFAGHALDAGVSHIQVAADILHVAGAAVWTGGLVQLALVLRTEPDRRDLIRRFSTLALASVAVIAVTGGVRALTELRSVGQLWTTGYGRLLIAKTALLAVLVLIGWVNRYRIIPSGRTAALRRTVPVELVLLAGLVVAVAILTDARPGRDVPRAAAAPATTGQPPLPARDAIVLAREDRDNALTLAAEPTQTTVTVVNGEGLGVNGLAVTIGGAPTSSCGPGCYRTETHPRGRVPVVVAGRRLVFTVPTSAPDGTALLARAGRTFRALRSVSYVERLASSTTDRIVSTFTLEAPNRVEYHILGGASAIVIGDRRWDKTNGRWIPSSQSPLPQPIPIWGSNETNAHVLSHTRNRVVISFLEPSVPAWFTVRFDSRTLHPLTVEMTATAHFMHHTYTAFNAPRRIFPPRK